MRRVISSVIVLAILGAAIGAGFLMAVGYGAH